MLSLSPAQQAWINMLRTTQLPQATAGSMVDTNPQGKKSYCALAILCLANGKNPEEKGTWHYCESVLGSYAEARAVYHQNDHLRLTFPQIADWAEVHFSRAPTIVKD